MTTKKRKFSPEVAQHVETVLDALARAEEGSPTAEWINDYEDAVEEAMGAAIRAGRPQPSTAKLGDFGSFIRENVRQWRQRAGITQAALADKMRRLGFDWKRITVAEVESGTRRVALEEVMAVAALFGVPVVQVLAPGEDDMLAWNGRALGRDEVIEMLIGPNVPLGDGGEDWTLARSVAGVLGQNDWRPAQDFWSKLRRIGRVQRALERSWKRHETGAEQ